MIVGIIFVAVLLGGFEASAANVIPATSANFNVSSRAHCGQQVGQRIYGGKMTDTTEFPWLVLLRYGDDPERMKMACGGALINNRYVLTAGHCSTGEIVQHAGPLTKVRLGEYDVRNDGPYCEDIDGYEDCTDDPIDVDIEDIIVHPEYDDSSISLYNDIALLRLKQTVVFTDFIRAICLPLPNEEVPSAGETLFVSGWGSTRYARSSRFKMKVNVPVVGNSRCKSIYRNEQFVVWPKQLCAGGVEGKDSCTGDSGGPLMYELDDMTWVAHGIVSFGGDECGLRGRPSIYTQIADYLDWIQDNMKN